MLQAEVAKLLPFLPDADPFASDDDDEEAERNAACNDEDTDCLLVKRQRRMKHALMKMMSMKMSSRIQNDYTCYFYG